MRKQAIIPLAVGLVVGLLAIKFGYDYLSNLKRVTPGDIGPTKTVVVAAKNLALATKITEEDVKLAKMPEQFVPEGVCTDTKQVIGKAVKTSVSARMPILTCMLSNGEGLDGVIPAGYRAVTVKVDEFTGVAGFIKPDDIVDVVGTFKLRRPGSSGYETVSKIVLQNVKVRAVGQQFRAETGGNANLVRSVTLLVKPADVERLQLAASEGKIRLVMRGPLDNGSQVTRGITLAKLLSGQDQLAQDAPTGLGVNDLFGFLAPKNKTDDANREPVQPSSTEQADQPYLVEMIHPDRIERIYFASADSELLVRVDTEQNHDSPLKQFKHPPVNADKSDGERSME